MPVEVHIREDGPASVVEFVGALDSSLPAETRRDIVSLIKPGCHVVFDLSGLDHLSGTGLRMLLLFIRAVQAVGGTVAGAGVPQELRDIAAAAGFLELFQRGPPVVALVMPCPPPVARVDIYPTHHHAGFALRPGFPLPFGSIALSSCRCSNSTSWSTRARTP
jgi:anti-anti-sigma factor